MKLRLITIILLIIISNLGCVSPESKEKNSEPVSKITPQITAKSTEYGEDSIQKFESRIFELEKRLSDIEETNRYNGIIKQSNKTLIPKKLPFKITVHLTKDLNYLVRENGDIEITEKDPIPRRASYTLYYNNNTIMIEAKNYSILDDVDYYGIRLFDNYAAAIYENGYIAWVGRYDIDYNPPKPAWDAYK